MKWKIGLLDSDTEFTTRLQDAFEEQYPNEIDFSVFSTFDQAVTAAEKLGLQLLLVEDGLYLSGTAACPILLLCTQIGVDYEPEDHAYRKVCKYKSVSDWYSLFCSYCRGKFAAGKGRTAELSGAGHMTLCLFLSGGGGTGTSTAAAAFAMHLARSRKKVVYLNFEPFSSTEQFFIGDGNYDMDDIIFSLRSRKYELNTLLRHALCRDTSGVYFLTPCSSVSDWFSLTGEEILQICDAITKNLGDKTFLVLDMNADATEAFVLPFLYAKKAVLVANGETLGNDKVEQLLNALPLLCNLTAFEVARKTQLLYNRFERVGGQLLDLPEIGKLGGINRTEADSPRSLMNTLADLGPFQRLEESLYV